MSKITIALPTHNMKNKEFFLRRSLDALSDQSFKDFDVIVSDNSDDLILEEIIKKEYPELTIAYYRNPIKGMAQNTNFAIEKCTGEIIKILYLDDYLAHKKSLQDIVDMLTPRWFSTQKHWLISAVDNNLKPYWTDNIHTGRNKLGSPSALAFRNKGFRIYFDEELTWLLDCDYYKRMHKIYGKPIILNKVNVNIGVGEHQMTNIITNERKEWEFNYLKKKYGK